jgi:hypothetical protein
MSCQNTSNATTPRAADPYVNLLAGERCVGNLDKLQAFTGQYVESVLAEEGVPIDRVGRIGRRSAGASLDTWRFEKHE